MVSSQFSGLTTAGAYKPLQTHLLFPADLPDTVNTEHIELDFSDVFGPVTVDLSNIDSTTGEPVEEVSELVYDDPEVIYTRSHSLVGPSTCVNQSLKLGKLTIHETEDSLELVEDFTGETIEDIKESSFVEESLKDEDGNLMKIQRVSIEDFDILKVVGQGAFAKVYQVRKKGTSEIYAMKVMRKDKIMEKNHAEYMKAERDIMTKIEHPFVVKLRYSFQTKYRLYLVLDFVNGGHLFFQLYHQGLFREDLARVYTAEIVSAVSHLHSNGIMHRDLKPENILLDADGHVMLTDFGLAKQFEDSTRSNSMCGTLEYMAPEIILGKGHDKAADWWSVGVLLFEMLTGKPPFCVGSRDRIQQKIVKDKIKLPAFLSSEAHSLLKGLLQKEATKRLGCGARGIEEIKGHKWFKPINWKRLEAREIQPSFRPEVAGKHCVANFEKRWTDMPVVDSPAASPNGGNPFKDFSYVRPAASFLQSHSPAC
ncbi:serine/threonine-protein kinase AtPK2/AtPK19-like [Abrus precatorius]|uniref:non-specific serine/threonine protein kinase n=1 Tax=Abrus precatorius TaxID=3816 RepID=A0A8B8L5P6_ABRPR|nr:serine/threonine-protein kinase AtPK2/AtPK19-like [Abrus precatorius]